MTTPLVTPKDYGLGSTRTLPAGGSGDQFNVYVCGRFVAPILTTRQQHEIGAGQLLLDEMTKKFIRDKLTFRYAVLNDGAQALALERAIRAGSLKAGRPSSTP
ncbi:MAG: hypothetical protein WA895_09505 [Streptosporangiaceae bacterium]